MKLYSVETLVFNGQKNFLEDMNVIFKRRLTDYKEKKVIYYDILFNQEQFDFFKDKIRKNFTLVEVNVLEAFCDGGLKKTSANVVTHTGYAVVLTKDGEELDRFSKAEVQGTNQTAELKGLFGAIRMSLKKATKDDIIVVTADSSYAIRGLYEYFHTWKNNGYKNSKNQLIENYDIWIKIFEERAKFENIYFRHVKSHTKNEGLIYKFNNIVDTMCTECIKDFVNSKA